MDFFDKTLENIRVEKFVTSFCLKCKKYIWPPNDSCNLCYSPVVLKNITPNGILLAKSTSYISGKKRYFGLGEFDGIRIIGTIQQSVNIGDRIIICSIREINGKIDLRFCADM